ncbi:hypothetical protein ACGF0J_01075 [Nonomuraea sp. NPDC047897]|uniref:hypothetical protein n=1 Tax=Nonomuraea sp. NPDC047897 TaxID=3364346 RepID=UPI003724AD16
MILTAGRASAGARLSRVLLRKYRRMTLGSLLPSFDNGYGINPGCFQAGPSHLDRCIFLAGRRISVTAWA